MPKIHSEILYNPNALTRQELEILALLARDYSYSEISRVLNSNASAKDVEIIFNNLMPKLGLYHNNTESLKLPTINNALRVLLRHQIILPNYQEIINSHKT